MRTKIVCTLGPASYSDKMLKKLKKEGVDIFRINLSHTPRNDIENKILYLKKKRVKNICIDTEGAQVRVSNVKKKIFFKNNKVIKIKCGNKISDNNKIFLTPSFDLLQINKGTNIRIGFDNLSIKIFKKSKLRNCLYGIVKSSGDLESRKGVHIEQKIKLSCVSEKDIYAMRLGLKHKIKIYAISFINSHKDLVLIKKILGHKKKIISKIETLSAIKDLKKISKLSSALLIDRGDLSRYIPIEKIPQAQEHILRKSSQYKIPTFVATNLLETMINKNLPSRAESNDIYSSLDKGAKGLVLAAETAVGNYPLECVKFLKRCISSFKNKKKFL